VIKLKNKGVGQLCVTTVWATSGLSIGAHPRNWFVSLIRMESRDTTDQKVILLGASVSFPLATSLALCCKDAIVTSKTLLHSITLHFLLSHWYLILIVELESYTDILHLLLNGIASECHSILFIKSNGLFNCLWQSYAIFMGLFPVFGLYLGDDMVCLLDDVGSPPVKSWLR
jgi:hypothetical protein